MIDFNLQQQPHGIKQHKQKEEYILAKRPIASKTIMKIDAPNACFPF